MTIFRLALIATLGLLALPAPAANAIHNNLTAVNAPIATQSTSSPAKKPHPKKHHHLTKKKKTHPHKKHKTHAKPHAKASKKLHKKPQKKPQPHPKKAKKPQTMRRNTSKESVDQMTNHFLKTTLIENKSIPEE